jgi:hypothetical protein
MNVRLRPETSIAPAQGKADTRRVLPLSDGIKVRRFPFVNVAIIAANAHVGAFVFGVLATLLLRGRLTAADARGQPLPEPI